MKVVLFCGGYGMRMRNDVGEGLPKPMQMVGSRPLLWHVMRYYAHFGHTEFILCLGYGATYIKDYFLNYAETESNDFTLADGKVELLSSDISDWSITFVDTGLESPIGERLRRVRDHLKGDEYFLANYADVLTDAPMDQIIQRFHDFGATASMMVVPPQSSFHCVELSEDGSVSGITPVSEFPIWENAGYFVLSQAIFDILPPGGDLVADVCGTLAGTGRLYAYKHLGFWKPADTFKERAELDEGYHKGNRPWVVWDLPAAETA
jgi:glucose-1-phosphate cytidylyltransferase